MSRLAGFLAAMVLLLGAATPITSATKLIREGTVVQYDIKNETISAGAYLEASFSYVGGFNGIDFKISSVSSPVSQITTASVVWKLSDGTTLSSETLTSGTDIAKPKSSFVTIRIYNPSSTSNITVTGNIIFRSNSISSTGGGSNLNASNISSGTMGLIYLASGNATSGQVLTWSSGSSSWVPMAVSGSAASSITPNYYMVTGNNLADVRSAASAVYNLGLGTTANVVFGGVSVNGTVSATLFSGSGASLTNLNASNISSGTVPVARVSGSYTGITGLGTISTGVWNGSVVPVQYGGSGAASTPSAVYNFGLGTTANVVFGTVSANGNISGNYLIGKQLDVLNSVVAASTTTLDFTYGNFFEMTQDTNISTFTWSNVPASGNVFKFYLKRIKDNTGTARTITWPASVKWAYGVSPVLSSTANSVDIFTFLTLDGGTTYYGMINGQTFQ